MEVGVGKLAVLLTVLVVLEATTVRYLKKTLRFNEPTLVDYYFSCSAVGETLQWRVNKQGLGGYDGGSRVGDTLVSSRSNFNYTATLLSLSSAGTPRQLMLVSMVMISVQGEPSLDVMCNMQSAENSTDNEKNISSIVNDTASSIYLEYVLTENVILTNVTMKTSIFLCNVQDLYQVLKMNRQNYGFGPSDKIGANRRIVSSDHQNHSIVEEQAILIARQTYQYLSVLFVTSTSDVIVTCACDKAIAQLSTSLDNLSTENTPSLKTTTTQLVKLSRMEYPVSSDARTIPMKLLVIGIAIPHLMVLL